MSVLSTLLLGTSVMIRTAGPVYTVAPEHCRWVEAEAGVSEGAVVQEGEDAHGGAFVRPVPGETGTVVRIPCEASEDVRVWVRLRGRGIGLKRRGEKDLWRWPKCAMWRWVGFGPLQAETVTPAFSLMGTADVDAVVVTADAAWQPLETPNQVATAWIDMEAPGRFVPSRLASANVNSPRAMLLDRDDWHAAVKDLGIRMMRFQVPVDKLDYRDREQWDENTFRELDRAVRTARTRWGVEDLMFGVHRLRLPMEDGRLLEEQFEDYADGIARMVRRYASPGHERVQYWEPFNELDHGNFLKKLAAHGQDFHLVARLYAVCSRAIKQVNPAVKVGGPAAMWPGGWETKMMLEAPGMLADFVSWHQYATGNAATSDDRVMTAVHREKGMIDGLHRIQKAVRESGVRQPLEFMLTEYHINHSIWNPPDARAADNFSAVYAASVLLNLGQQGADALMIHDVLSRHYGLLGPISGDAWARASGRVAKSVSDDPIHVRPVGWVVRWFNEFVQGRWHPCIWLATPDDWKASPRAPVVEVGAAVDEGRAVILVINRDRRDHALVLTGLADAQPAAGPFDCPVQVLTVDGFGPRRGRFRPPSSMGRWECLAPSMSVSFVILDLAEAE